MNDITKTIVIIGWTCVGLASPISAHSDSSSKSSLKSVSMPESAPVVLHNQVEKEIYATLLRFCAALKRKDLDAAMTLYSADFKQTNSHNKTINNKASTRRVLAKLLTRTAAFQVRPTMVLGQSYRGSRTKLKTVEATVPLGMLKQVTYKKPAQTSSFAWTAVELTQWVKTKQGWKLKSAQQTSDIETNAYLESFAH